MSDDSDADAGDALTESELVELISPISGFAFAAALQQFMKTGLYDHLYRLPPGQSVGIPDLAAPNSFDASRLKAFLWYLVHEGVLEEANNEFSMTRKGRDYARVRGWYEMLVGGYGRTLLEFGDALPVGAESAKRDGYWVSVGSSRISAHDTIPLVLDLLARNSVEPNVILDYGCGDGAYLLALAQRFPLASCIGVELDDRVIELARRHANDAGSADRMNFVRGAIGRLDISRLPEGDLTVLCFVLEELLGSLREEGVVALLSSLGAPRKWVVVVESDYRPADRKVMQSRLGHAYYNPYFLLHPFTGQELRPSIEWERLFDQAGLEAVDRAAVDGRIDSTELEVGWLLRGRN